MTHQIAIAYGDNNSPELMEAVMDALREAGAVFEIEALQIGEYAYKLGFERGFDNEMAVKIGRIKTVLKAPTAAPENGEVDNVSKHLCEYFELEYGKVKTALALAHIGKEIAVFEAAEATKESMFAATILMLEHLNETEVTERFTQQP